FIALSGGYLFLALFFTMIACLILGMGLLITANYVVTATVAAPALINGFDLAPIAVHMFVLDFGIVADITPPVCLAAYAGAGMARANPVQGGVSAVKLENADVIMPYIFAASPIPVMGKVTVIPLLLTVVTSILGMSAVSSAMIGFYIRNSRYYDRLILFVAGVCLIIPELTISLVGLALLAVIWFLQKQRDDDSGSHREA